MRKLNVLILALSGLLPSHAAAQIHLERSFPPLFLLQAPSSASSAMTNLDNSGGLDALLQVEGGYDIVELGTGLTIASLRWASIPPLEGGPASIHGFADLDNDGTREVVLSGSGHVLAVDRFASSVKFDLAPPSPPGAFIGFTVLALGDLDGDGADEVHVGVAEWYPPPNSGGGIVRTQLYGSGPPTLVGEDAGQATRLGALQIRPNPSRSTIQIALDAVSDRTTVLRIFDAAGRVVRDFRPPAGSREVQWDGLDSAGHGLAAGVYFVEVASGAGIRASRKLVRVD